MSKELAGGMCFYNPYNYKVMDENLKRTCECLLKSWPDIWVIELIYNNPELNQKSIELPSKVRHFKVYADSLMWHKEQLLNVLAKEALRDGYAAFAAFDADILFPKEDWPQRIIAKLEDYPIVQCYTQGWSGWHPDKDAQSKKPSTLKRFFDEQKFNWSFPGGAWAMHKDFWDIGLFDYNIIGGGDTVFISALLNTVAGYDDWERKNPQLFSDSYRALYLDYRKKLNERFGAQYMYVNQEAFYQVHGARKYRCYSNRQKAIEQIDLFKELRRNRYGLTEWVDPQSLRARFIDGYFKARNTDAEVDFKLNMAIPCVCLRDCVTASRRIVKGEECNLSVVDLNTNFEVKWV